MAQPYEVRIEKRAVDGLRAMPKSDAGRMLARIEALADNPRHPARRHCKETELDTFGSAKATTGRSTP